MSDTSPSTGMGRRGLLRGAGIAAALAAVAPLEALASRAAAAAPGDESPKKQFSPDYGPLYPTKDHTTGLELLLLPRGFEYLSYGWTGDPMLGGVGTPAAHDGMAAYRRGDDKVVLVRNHEVGSFSGRYTDPAYDPQAGGGTTNVVFDPDAGQFVEAWPTLSGTIRNCAGGPTPWSTWLTCEETSVVNTTNGLRHGYVFEVPTAGVGNAEPIKAMGRFEHEAVAVDPATGYVYETEDANPAGFYRYRPNVVGDLHAGGALEMLVINGGAYDTRRDGTGTVYASTSWVPIADPDPAPPARMANQGFAQGGAVFARLEGAWYAEGKVYIVSTSGGPASQGQIFEYEPSTGALRVLFASPSASVLNNPDNICVSPRRGIVLCEDGSGVEYLHGLTTDGDIFPFAANNVQVPHRRPAGPAEDRTRRLPRLRVVRQHLRAQERQLAVREHPVTRYHVRHHRPLDHRLALTEHRLTEHRLTEHRAGGRAPDPPGRSPCRVRVRMMPSQPRRLVVRPARVLV